MAFVYWIHLPEHTDMFTEGYIGFTSKTVEHRLSIHQREATRNSGRSKNYPLYNSMRKYNESIVVTTLIEGSNEYCLDIEFRLRPSQRIGWNITIGGKIGSLGFTPTDVTRKKLSEKMLGSNNPLYGKSHTEETKLKISAAKKGISTWSEDTKKRMSEVRRGRKLNLSEEQRVELARRAGSRVRTLEEREKTRNSLLGSKASDETKRKISEALKKRFANSWESHAANKYVWATALEAYYYLLNSKDATQKSTADFLELSSKKVYRMFLKLKSGWNPSEDSEYLEWLSVYKEQNEKQ